MSIIRCSGCERSVDTDFVDCEVVEHKYGNLEFCPSCAERRQDELDRGDAMASMAEEIEAGVRCPRCTQDMPDRDSAEGCEDLFCPFMGGDQ